MTREQDKPALYRPRHGGDIHNAVDQYGGKLEDWLDLSTGISPWGYPIPVIDEASWRELPGNTDELTAVAAHYYQCEENAIFPTPGSQLAIRLLPNLINTESTVAIPTIGYQEHGFAWQQAGHQLKRYSNFDELARLVDQQQVDNAVVINPNNPTCYCAAPSDVLALGNKLSGVLLVDEAFADLDNSLSLASKLSEVKNSSSNIIIMRSLGKFFGLAGARLGFVISQHPIAKQLKELLSPWSINAPILHIAQIALADTAWQQAQRLRIEEQNQALAKLLYRHLDIEAVSADKQTKNNAFSMRLNMLNTKLSYQTRGLFSTLAGKSGDIVSLHKQLAAQCIWTRLGDDFFSQNGATLNWLRLSLPGDRFATVLKAFANLNN